MTRRVAHAGGLYLCSWDDTCPFVATYSDPGGAWEDLCGHHWRAWERGERPEQPQPTLDLGGTT